MARRRFELTDEQFERIEGLLPEVDGRGRPYKNHRKVVNGLFWILRTGAPWRDLPDRYGEWQTVYDRFRTWIGDGTLDRILDRLQNELDLRDKIDWERFNMDGATVPARRAAGGPTDNRTGAEVSKTQR